MANPQPQQRRAAGRSGIHLGSIGGVEVTLDYSWFVIFFLILATFTGVVFPAEVPGLGQGAYVVMGLAGTVLFFASLLGHELAHSFVAIRRGIPVEGITLFIFGGMARTRSEASSPGDEFVIAGVGPLASFAFAAAFWGVALVSVRAGLGPAVTVVAGHLALLNVALAVFNLAPGFPLDGGRLLRATVWKITGSLRTATRVATTAGRWLGFGISGLGIFLLFFTGNLIGGLWLIFIGWFLAQAASASYQQLLLREVMKGILAQDAMTPEPETVTPDVTLDRLVHDYFLRRPYNAFPVTEDGIIVGVVTLSQVKEVPREEWPRRRAADVMTALVDTLVVSPEAPMTEVLERMAENRSSRVIVARDLELLGIISGRDVANWLERAGLVRES